MFPRVGPKVTLCVMLHLSFHCVPAEKPWGLCQEAPGRGWGQFPAESQPKLLLDSLIFLLSWWGEGQELFS